MTTDPGSAARVPVDLAELRSLALNVETEPWDAAMRFSSSRRYILAASPAVVLDLLDDNAAKDAEIARLRGVMTFLASYIETMPDEYASKADIANRLRAALGEEG